MTNPAPGQPFRDAWIKLAKGRGLTVLEENATVFRINGKKVNVRYREISPNKEEYWFRPARTFLNTMDIFVWICSTPDRFYAIPREEMKKFVTPGMSFNLSELHHYLQCDGKKFPIKEFYRNWEIFSGSKVRSIGVRLPVGTLVASGPSLSSSIPAIDVIAENSLAAEKMVIKHEENIGRDVKSVSLRTVGYDIESKSKSDPADIKYIEVKSRLGSFPVTLTKNEKRVADEKGEKYFLYVVTDEHTINIVQAPSKLTLEEKVVINYEVKNWESSAKVIKI